MFIVKIGYMYITEQELSVDLIYNIIKINIQIPEFFSTDRLIYRLLPG